MLITRQRLRGLFGGGRELCRDTVWWQLLRRVHNMEKDVFLILLWREGILFQFELEWKGMESLFCVSFKLQSLKTQDFDRLFRCKIKPLTRLLFGSTFIYDSIQFPFISKWNPEDPKHPRIATRTKKFNRTDLQLRSVPELPRWTKESKVDRLLLNIGEECQGRKVLQRIHRLGMFIRLIEQYFTAPRAAL
ncbi:hypothetical protein JTE90_021925 [Oedothorax gibbosus]|uniref:Uncharacterized protein n=1 Tax=Oedothorax gibbosus TaxID=931172 RepID=A0AAV6VX12_9ARAC|nr:hypothetical protein JTE90_021925 [Oedothorax gibbosus]